jgi:hypothetical protein
MAMARTFEIIYAPEVEDHLFSIERKYHSLIRDTILRQLAHEPLHETRNRKPLLRKVNWGPEWELRFGPDNRFRVFYSVDAGSAVVRVVAVGLKRGNRLKIGRQQVQL